MTISKANQVVLNCLVCCSDPILSVASSHVTYPLVFSQVSYRSNRHTIKCVQTPPTSRSHSLCPSRLHSHAIARDRPRLSFPLRLPINTMTPPISTGFQALCFLPEDPPHRMKSPPLSSTVSKFMRLNQTSPLNTFSTLLPPQRSIPPPNQLFPPSIEFTLPLHNESTLPLSSQILPPTQRSSPLPSSRLPPQSATLLPPPSSNSCKKEYLRRTINKHQLFWAKKLVNYIRKSRKKIGKLYPKIKVNYIRKTREKIRQLQTNAACNGVPRKNTIYSLKIDKNNSNLTDAFASFENNFAMKFLINYFLTGPAQFA